MRTEHNQSVARVRCGDTFQCPDNGDLATVVSGRLVVELTMSYGLTLPLVHFAAGDALPVLEPLSTAAFWLHYRAEEPTQIARIRHLSIANDDRTRLSSAQNLLLSACMRQINALACLPAAYRLYVELLRCFSRANGSRFDLPCHGELACRAMTTRETVSRELSILRREKVLTAGKTVELLAPIDLKRRIARLLNLDGPDDVWGLVRLS